MDFWNKGNFSNNGYGDDNGNNHQNRHNRDSENSSQNNNFNGNNGYQNNNSNSDRGYQSNNFNGNNGYQNSDFRNNRNDNCGYAPDKEKIDEKINEYQGKSEQELMSELLGKVSGMKNDGSFDIAEIEEFYQKSSSFLTPSQLQKLRSLINMLK